MTALHVTLADGWKTYWRSPGDAGIPPEFDWANSQNVASVQFIWPTPDVFSTNGMRTIGYHKELVLPIRVTPRDPSRPVVLNAHIEMGVCSDICVPTFVDINNTLQGTGSHDPRITDALAHGPVSGRTGGISRLSCSVTPIADGMRVTARFDMPPQGRHEIVVMEPGNADIWASEARVARHGRSIIATSDMVGPSGAPFALDRGAINLTVLGGPRAVELQGCPAG